MRMAMHSGWRVLQPTLVPLAAGFLLLAAGSAMGSKPKSGAVAPGRALIHSTVSGTEAESSQVARAQKALAIRGRLKRKPVRGRLDVPTRRALRSFQKEHALKVTGTLTRETMASLGLSQDSSLSR